MNIAILKIAIYLQDSQIAMKIAIFDIVMKIVIFKIAVFKIASKIAMFKTAIFK